MNGVNCYKNYSYYYFYNNSDNKYYSTNNFTCPENYKLIEDKNECIDNCSRDLNYSYEFNNKCYMACPFGSNSSENNKYLCKCNKYYDKNINKCFQEIPKGYYYINGAFKQCDEKCLICSFESISQNNSCLSCNASGGFYPKIDKNKNNSLFTECYSYNNIPYGYYFENDSYILDKRCDKFEEYKFNNSLKYSYFSDFSCPKYYYCDSSNNYFCIEECPVNYPKFIKNKTKCIDYCKNDNIFKYEYKNNCYESCPKRTNISSNNSFFCEDIYIYDCNPTDFFIGNCKLNNNKNTTNNINNNNINDPKSKDEMIKNIKNEIMNGGMDDLISEVIQNDKNDLIINEDNTIFQITSTENQKNNKNNNISSII